MRTLFYRVMLTAPGLSYDLSKDLTSFTVEEDDQMADKLTVVVPDPFKVFSYALQEGLEVEVDLGYVDNHSVIFRGLVTQVDAEFPQDGVPSVTMRAFDSSIRMGLRRRNRPWQDIDLQGIVSTIAQENRFFSQDIALPQGGNPTYSGNGIRQQEETDLAFLHRLAGDQHCKVFVEPTDTTDRLVFKAEQQIMDADPATRLLYGHCSPENQLLSFSVQSDVSRRQRPRVYGSIDPVQGREADAQRQADPPRAPGGSPYDQNLAAFSRRHPARSAALAPLLQAATDAYQTVFEAMGSELREITAGLHGSQDLRQRTTPQATTVVQGIVGQGATAGNKDLRAKRNVQIEAVGGRFSGKWYLSQVRHLVDGNGYRTQFTCSR